MFRKMPVILMAVIVAVLLFSPYMSLPVKQFFYTLSLTLKTTIVFLLPVIIFALLFKAAVSLSGKASKVIGLLLVMVCASNFLTTFLSHFVGEWITKFDVSLIVPKETESLMPLWGFELPKLIPNDVAMFGGILLGLFCSKFYSSMAVRLSTTLEKIVTHILSTFVLFIPLFVAGFIVKLQYDNMMSVILQDYLLIFAVIALAQYSYILLGYFLVSGCRMGEFISSIKHMLPAVISGFSTMSSAASMPLTIIAAEANAKDKNLARSVIPATVNIHLIGDCFAIPIFAYAVIKSFGMAEPSLVSYFIFNIYFVLAKFSVAAIPGGGIIVMLPILEAYLGFNADMMLLITSLYILFDPVITSANVFGNGMFAKFFDKLMLIKSDEAIAEGDTARSSPLS